MGINGRKQVHPRRHQRDAQHAVIALGRGGALRGRGGLRGDGPEPLTAGDLNLAHQLAALDGCHRLRGHR